MRNILTALLLTLVALLTMAGPSRASPVQVLSPTIYLVDDLQTDNLTAIVNSDDQASQGVQSIEGFRHGGIALGPFQTGKLDSDARMSVCRNAYVIGDFVKTSAEHMLLDSISARVAELLPAMDSLAFVSSYKTNVNIAFSGIGASMKMNGS